MVKLAALARGGNSLKLSSHFMEKRRRRVLEGMFLHEPVVVLEALLAALERIGAQVEELGNTHRRQRLAPDIETGTALLGEDDLEPPHAHRHAVAVVAPVDEALARRLLLLAGEERHQVEAVEMHLERLVADLVALLHLLDQVGLAVRRREGRE